MITSLLSFVKSNTCVVSVLFTICKVISDVFTICKVVSGVFTVYKVAPFVFTICMFMYVSFQKNDACFHV